MWCVAAIEKKIAGPDNGKLYTEDDWNNEATIDKYPYHLSKVGAPSQDLPLTGSIASKLGSEAKTEERDMERGLGGNLARSF